MNFIAEKVIHKPLVMAFHASGSGWELNATSSGKTKFWGVYAALDISFVFFDANTFTGKSFEIIPTGTTYLRIGEDEFEWFVVCFVAARPF